MPSCPHIYCCYLFILHFLYFYFWLHLVVCGILIPRPGIKPMPPAVEGKALTTGPPGKSYCCYFSLENSFHLLPPSFLIIVRHLFPLDTLPTTGQPAPIWFGSFFHIGWLSSRVLKIYHSLNSFQVEARTLSVSPTLVQCQTHSRTSINVYWMTSQILDISVHRK